MTLKKILRRINRRAAVCVGAWLLRELPAISKAMLPKFANEPLDLVIEWPWRISHPEAIYFGNNVWLGPGSFLTAVSSYPTPSLKHPQRTVESKFYKGEIHFGDRVTCSGGLIIGAANEVRIGDDVLLSSNVTILDNLHGYESMELPFKYQPLEKIAPVHIGAGSWIGQNAVILPGVTIGEMAVIGANSVVTHAVPPHSIAAGAPARVIKSWNEKAGEWRACKGVARRADRLRAYGV